MSNKEVRIRPDANGETFSVFEVQPEGYEEPVITGCSIQYASECARRILFGLPITQTQF